ncbi:TRAP transporter small permease subunit [Paragemmobacter ruber]|uniref:TRAP transporter small permease protein n=1 Tax=Paragemmobacter ruber TaxID=1985673 RepID=A0ABW9Y447_9RHOB|nr:TRAP transporter small permease subunit [Rhodobacter ruber]NBE07269.1 TRAP transporter small permease subunit [Rhodobacter ruber]
MRGLLGLSSIIDRVNEVIGRTMGWLILIAVLVSATNAVIRKLFSVSSNAWLELQWYLFGAAFLLAAAYTLRDNGHVRIDVLYGRVSERTRQWIDLLGHLFFLMPFSVLMVVYLVPYTVQSYTSGEVSTNSGGLIIWPAKALMLVGFVLLTVQGISEIIKKIAIMQGIIEDPNPFHNAKEQAELEAQALLEQAMKEEVRK